MAFFDFFKGKNKKGTQETKPEESKDLKPDAKSPLEAEGLEITPLSQETEEDIALKLAEDKRGMAAANRAISNAMDTNEVHFQISAGGTMYGRGERLDDIEDDSEKEIAEITEEVLPEGVEKPEETQEEGETEAEKPEEESEDQEEKSEEEAKTEAEKPEEEAETEAEKPEEDAEIEPEKPTKKGFFSRLVEGLGKTRKTILDNVDGVLGAFTKIDEELFEELEEVLIMADLGVETTMHIIENLRKRVKKEKATDPQSVKGLLVEEITAILEEDTQAPENLPNPTVMLVIGVNGVGKTTTIGKLAQNFKNQGKSVLLAAADTFRAAAIDQLEIWGQRAGIEVIKQHENADPAAVVFDAVNAAKRRKADLLICDTAGRLHNKKNLMDELKKIAKVIDREYPDAHKEIYLVLDATTGQNAMQQAKLFKEAADITGIILTKLDGTAKGGIVIAIKSELKIPVRYIGVGEGIADLQEFDSKSFAKALFGEN